MAHRWKTMETVTDFIFGGAADGDCSHEIQRHLLLERKAMRNLDSILKSRDISLPTNVHIVKVMAFPVVMYECECDCGLVAQSRLTLFDPMDYSPPGSCVHRDSLGKNTGVGCHTFLQGIFPTQGLNLGLPHSGGFFIVWTSWTLEGWAPKN